MTKPHAALIRENDILRDVASKAIRLRNLGRLSDKIEAAYEEMYENNPDMARSMTMRMMHEQAFDTAMQDFDEAVVKAVESGMDWAKDVPRQRQWDQIV